MRSSWVPSPVSDLVDTPNVASARCPGCAPVLASHAETDAATNRPWCERVHRAVRAHRPARPVTALSRHDDVERGS